MSPDPQSSRGRLTPTSREERRAQAIRAWSDARSLLFVCLGNVCRSPFAERLLLERLGDDRHATSAGHYPVSGRRPPEPAVATARRFGVELASHRSRVLSPEMVERADAVFVFDEENYGAVVAREPSAAERTHLLGALCDEGPLVIEDPFGAPTALYERVYRQIADAVEAGERGREGGV